MYQVRHRNQVLRVFQRGQKMSLLFLNHLFLFPPSWNQKDVFCLVIEKQNDMGFNFSVIWVAVSFFIMHNKAALNIIADNINDYMK